MLPSASVSRCLRPLKAVLTSVRPSSVLVRENPFRKERLSTPRKISHGFSSYSHRKSHQKVILASSGLLSGFLASLGFDEYLAKDEPLIDTIKRGIYCQQLEDYDKAELIFHAALNSAREESNRKAETYLYGCLGNNAFLKGDYDKSEKVYKELIKRLLEDGGDEKSEAIVEISLKIATIYSKTDKLDKAEIGFRHCLNNQKDRLNGVDLDKPLDPEVDKSIINSVALYGMALDWYGKHLLRHNDYQGALEYTKKALEMCEKASGKDSHQTMVLLSDIGCIYNLLNAWDESVSYLEKAANLARTLGSSHMKVIIYNLGMSYLMKNKWDESFRNCNAAYRLAKNDSDETIMELSAKCIKQAKAQKVTDE